MLFQSDLVRLNYNQQSYAGYMGQRCRASPSSFDEMQILRFDGTIGSPWFTERALITPPLPGALQYRLSGNGMRNHLFFATALGNANSFHGTEEKWYCDAAANRLKMVFMGMDSTTRDASN